jgi:hypothetical protein
VVLGIDASKSPSFWRHPGVSLAVPALCSPYQPLSFCGRDLATNWFREAHEDYERLPTVRVDMTVPELSHPTHLATKPVVCRRLDLTGIVVSETNFISRSESPRRRSKGQQLQLYISDEVEGWHLNLGWNFVKRHFGKLCRSKAPASGPSYWFEALDPATFCEAT